MKILKRPMVGQKIRLDEFGAVAIVKEIIEYEPCFAWQIDSERRVTNKELRVRLGDNFMALYFECDLIIDEVKDESRFHKKGDIIRLTWDEIQRGEFVY